LAWVGLGQEIELLRVAGIGGGGRVFEARLGLQTVAVKQIYR
jgi:hypothetical protein